MSKFHEIIQVKQLDARKAVQSHFVTPLTLAIIRTVWLIFSLAAVIGKLVYNHTTPIKYVMFLTNLSFYGLTAYLIVSTYLSWRYVHNDGFVPWLNQHYSFRVAYFILYQFCLLISLVVTIVYWSMLAKQEFSGNPTSMAIYLSVAMHAFNFIICLTEGVLSQNPVIISHLPFIIVIALLYIPYAILLHAIYGVWPYFFLDYHHHPYLFAGVIIGIVIASIIFHLILYKLHQIRDRRFHY